jgi:hypothetical protein
MVSFLVVSLIIFAESLIMVAESPIVVLESLIIEVVSVTVVDDSVDSFFVLEQAVASAITDSKKKADFFMVVLN